MNRRIIYVSIAVLALALVVAVLAQLSYRTTWRRTYGAVPPLVIEITVTDAAGQPVPRPTLKLIDAATLEAADNPFFDIDPRAGSTGDDQGRVALRYKGQAFETEDWRPFWVFRRDIAGSRGLDAYVVDISAANHESTVVALPELLHTPSGTVPLPNSDQQAQRYVAQVMLP